jgi:hypothetical protein
MIVPQTPRLFHQNNIQILGFHPTPAVLDRVLCKEQKQNLANLGKMGISWK